ncbi:MAG: MFS transporter [Planctomycetes bacterium]|nr:MFS transporter [Planctomycetota bacterium]
MTLPAEEKPTNVRYGVLGFACVLSMITYLDRVCFGTVMPFIEREFKLSESDKGWLFTAFAFAYAAFEVPTGWLGDKYGARNTLIRIVLWWSVFTALTGAIFPTEPVFVAFGLMLTVRFLFGIGEAGAYPNIARAFHNWFPFEERGFAKGAVWMAGRFAGGITAFVVYALMYETATEQQYEINLGGFTFEVLTHEVQSHWRHIFYLFGAVGVIWCVFWWLWYRDNPAEKAGVNAAEVALIHGGEPPHTDQLVVPWGKLLTSTNLWFLCIMYFCAAYGWYLNITYFPGYLKDVLKIEPGPEKWTWQFWEAGLMVGLPLLIGSVSCLIGGYLTDVFIRQTGNRKWGRRLFGVIGHGLCACCYFISIFYMTSPWTWVLLIAFAAFWNDLTMGAAWASCLDIGKRYSGIVAGCMNTVGNLGGALAGVLTGKILDWHTAGLVKDTPAYISAKDEGWTVNIILWGSAYCLAVFCWFWFDATKPIEPDAGSDQ